ncbi:MAG: methyltransferase [Thauera sp.]|nr:methyltransferase [Thauera sp.]
MPLQAIEQLLKQTMGLNAASIGSSAITRAVQQRMRDRGIAGVEDYRARLQVDSAELQRLIDLVIVPETWFFRDRNPFLALARHARDHCPARSRGRTLRILSVPSSTGEEPYTIVMTLLDAGLKPGEFSVDAVDISEPNLQRARAGVYREHSFRGDDLAYRDRYFARAEDGYLLNAGVRDQVSFHHANLLAPGFFAGTEPYDVVFCRNLLIYFDRDTQAQALRVLERLLQPQGLLFLGHAESGVLAGRQFAPLDHARSFAFVRGAAQRALRAEPAFQLPQRRRSAPAAPPAKPVPARPFADMPKPVVAEVKPAPAPVPQDLETATRLANEGHLVEAATLCESHLLNCGPDAQAFYLLALVREAVGEPLEAESLLRKALYLEPNHYEALTHLAVILEQRGDLSNAALVRQRAKRCFERLQDEAARRADGA